MYFVEHFAQSIRHSHVSYCVFFIHDCPWYHNILLVLLNLTVPSKKWKRNPRMTTVVHTRSVCYYFRLNTKTKDFVFMLLAFFKVFPVRGFLFPLSLRSWMALVHWSINEDKAKDFLWYHVIRWWRSKIVQTRNIAHFKEYNLQSQEIRLFIYTGRWNLIR